MDILKPGQNCWRIERADRVAFLIDGAAYFATLRDALRNACQAAYIISWDIYSELQLVRDDDNGGSPPSETLKSLLNEIARKRRSLHAYILNWDFVMLYGMDREWLPIYRLDWDTHRRVHFCLDDQYPAGGSHHQKIVTIDDSIAFAGGLDLTRDRWDTPRHDPVDPPRRENGRPPSRPHHDVQMAVSGDAARALGDLARERWRRACGHSLPACDPSAGQAEWPSALRVDMEDVMVGIARTEPAYAGRDEVREVEQLYLDAIAAARRFIYIENQYLTASRLIESLAARLEQADAPEILLVVPLLTTGWLSQFTMDVLRVRAIRRLKRADTTGRLHVLYPQIPAPADTCVNVHAKVMVVDDRFVRVGSANLNNRSMGLDTECDLAVEAGDRERNVEAIAGFRRTLLAEHLGTDCESVARAERQQGSLIAAVDSLRGGPRTLVPLPLDVSPEVEKLVAEMPVLDPERPIDPEALARQFLHEGEPKSAGRRVALGVAVLVLLLGLAAAWRWGPLSHWSNLQVLLESGRHLAALPAAPWLAVGVFVVAGLVVFPVTLLVILTVMVFGTATGFIVAVTGMLASALCGYGIGAALGRSMVRRLAGRRLNAISRRLAKRSLVAVILTRVIPIAPFTVINVVAGASHIRRRDFAIGTLLGSLPGIAAVALFTDRVRTVLLEPTSDNLAMLLLVLAGIVLCATLLIRWLQRRSGNPGSTSAD